MQRGFLLQNLHWWMDRTRKGRASFNRSGTKAIDTDRARNSAGARPLISTRLSLSLSLKNKNKKQSKNQQQRNKTNNKETKQNKTTTTIQVFIAQALLATVCSKLLLITCPGHPKLSPVCNTDHRRDLEAMFNLQHSCNVDHRRSPPPKKPVIITLISVRILPWWARQA